MKWTETTDSFTATLHRKGKRAQSTFNRSWIVSDVDDNIALHDSVNATLSSDAFYTIGDYTFMVEKYDVECIAPMTFKVTAQYTKAGADSDTPTPLSRTRQFDTTGSTMKVTQAFYETRYGFAVPDMQGVVNADGSTVNGVDIVVPALTWTETYDIPDVYVTAAYIKTVAQMTGCVNSAAYKTFAPGEVLFLGCNGQQEWDTEKGNGPWRLSYKFSASPNAGDGQTYPAMTIGPVTGIEKAGHDFLWVRYADKERSNRVVKEAEHVYVDQVYRRVNLSLLGIGA